MFAGAALLRLSDRMRVLGPRIRSRDRCLILARHVTSPRPGLERALEPRHPTPGPQALNLATFFFFFFITLDTDSTCGP